MQGKRPLCYNKIRRRKLHSPPEKGGYIMNKKNNHIALIVLWSLAAALLVVSGIGCMVNSGEIMDIMADWIGILVVLSGLLQLGVSWIMRRTIFGNRSFLTKGVVAVVVGIFIMCKSFIAGEVLRVLISMMVLVDGIGLLGSALDMRQDRIPGRAWLWVIGILEAFIGIAGFLKPEILSITVGVIIGVSLVYEGLSLLYTMFIGVRWYKALHQ